MELYCGIDLHSTNSVVVVHDAEGKQVYRKRAPNDIKVISAMLRPFSSSLSGVAVESTYNWYWLVDGLMDLGFKVHLANPAAMQKYDGLKHSDDNSDAAWLAEMLRLGILPTGYIYPKQERPVRDLLRKRSYLVRQRTANVLSIKNSLARHGIRNAKVRQIIQWSDDDVRNMTGESNLFLSLKSSHEITVCITEQIKAVEDEVFRQAKLRPEYKLLLTVTGIGKILALTIMLETGSIKRFPKVGNYSSYCRCTDSKRTSNFKPKGRGNAKNGNKYLAWAFIEAATFASWHDPMIRRFHQRKKNQSRLNVLATKAVAHKLARACYYILRDQIPFDVGRAFA